MENKERKVRYGLPLPDVIHLELSAEEIGNRAVFVIGDVHGCYDEMAELMIEASKREKDILFILTGDFVSRGPTIKQVVRRIQQEDCMSVVGNHELNCMREARSLKEDPNYDLPERYQWIRSLSEDDLNFIRQLPYTISIPHLKTHIVHAGLVPGLPLQEQCLVAITNMRNIYLQEGKLKPTNKYDKGEAWATFWTGPEHIYFGHDVKRGLQKLKCATGLDSGCCLGQRLTGVFINGCKELISVQAHMVYHVDKDD